MMERITYLITGANRGIGLGLVASLLQRGNTTIIATVRDKNTTDCTALRALPLGAGSVLHIESLLVADEQSIKTLTQTLTSTLSIANIDVVIANAGIGTSFASTLDTSLSSLRENFETNTLAPILLFKSLNTLLLSSPTAATTTTNPKFIVISSALGSTALLCPGPEGAAPTLAYGISKAAVNHFVRKLHFEIPELVTLAIHPGWVKTANGQAFADAVGVSEPPLTVEQSVEGVLKQIDQAKKDTTSGNFVSYNGTVLEF